MAEEKKPNLKDRLKKTQVGANQGPAGPGAPMGPPGADISAPPGIAAPPGISGPAAFPSMGGLGGMGGDVAPPSFVQEQQAAQAAQASQAAASARARAVADDPFGSGQVVQASQDIRIVVDERPVDDKEVGKSNRGTILAVVVTGALCLGVGFLAGIQKESNTQDRQTLLALTTVKEKAQLASAALASAKTKIEAACEKANISSAEEGQQQAAPTHPPEIDMELVTWFGTSGGDAPFGADVFAARMGKLTPEISQKIAGVHVMFAELWRQLTVHTGACGDGTAVRESLRAQADASALTQRLGMVFRQPQPNSPWVGSLVLAAQLNVQAGTVTLTPGANIATPATPRTIFLGTTPLTAANLGSTYVSINVTDGLGPRLQTAAGMQYLQYRARLQSLKSLVAQLATAHEALTNRLNGTRGG